MAKTTLTTIKVDGTRTDQDFEGGVPQLEDLYKAIDCQTIEVVPYFTRFEGVPCVAFCDEEGKTGFHGVVKEFNPSAHSLWESALGRKIPYSQDFLVGNIAIVHGDPVLMRDL